MLVRPSLTPWTAALFILGACGRAPAEDNSGDGSGVAAKTSFRSDSGWDATSDSASGTPTGSEQDGAFTGLDAVEGSASSVLVDGTVDASADTTRLESGVASNPSFILGADITSTQQDVAGGATFVDNGVPKTILRLLKDHGVNYIRLRTFVDPTQPAPNPRGGILAPYSPRGFADLAHTIAFGREIKTAGLGFLLDFHYSDTWADPGKQIKPAAWVNDDVPAAVTHMHDYTLSSLQALVAAGARPDMVQIGNEITPGLLLTPGTPLGPSSTAGWPDLARLLKAGIGAVREVDPTIKVMLHIDRGGDPPGTPPGSALASSIAFIESAVANGVQFDVFGESCYVVNQGPPSGWKATFEALAMRFPTLQFVMAEYNVDPANQTGPEVRVANDILFGLPNHRGLGTFIWDPTRTVPNPGIFTSRGNVYTVIPACIDQYDQMRTAYGL